MHGTSAFTMAAIYAGGDHVHFAEGCAPHTRALLISLLKDPSWEHARDFLQFCTASTVLPLADHPKSLRHEPISVESVPARLPGGGLMNTPTASTCFRRLYVPESHTTVEVLRDRFELAFSHMQTDGFRYE